MTGAQTIALYELLLKHTNDKAKSLSLLNELITILNEETEKPEKQIIHRKIEIQGLEYLGLIISIIFLTIILIYVFGH